MNTTNRNRTKKMEFDRLDFFYSSPTTNNNKSIENQTQNLTENSNWTFISSCQNGSPWPRTCYSIPVAVVLIILATLLMALITFGNVLVITAVVYEPKLRRMRQNWLIVSLAAADIWVGCLIMPMTMTYEIFGEWIFGWIMCELWLALDVLFVTSSILNLCAISLDRYWSLTDPMQYPKKRTSTRMSLTIVIVWFLAFLISFPPLVGWRALRAPGQCTLSHDVSYVLYSAFGSFYIPVTVLMIVYIRIFRIIHLRSKARMLEAQRRQTALSLTAALGPLQTSQGRKRRHHRLSRLFVTSCHNSESVGSMTTQQIENTSTNIIATTPRKENLSKVAFDDAGVGVKGRTTENPPFHLLQIPGGQPLTANNETQKSMNATSIGSLRSINQQKQQQQQTLNFVQSLMNVASGGGIVGAGNDRKRFFYRGYGSNSDAKFSPCIQQQQYFAIGGVGNGRRASMHLYRINNNNNNEDIIHEEGSLTTTTSCNKQHQQNSFISISTTTNNSFTTENIENIIINKNRKIPESTKTALTTIIPITKSPSFLRRRQQQQKAKRGSRSQRISDDNNPSITDIDEVDDYGQCRFRSQNQQQMMIVETPTTGGRCSRKQGFGRKNRQKSSSRGIKEDFSTTTVTEEEEEDYYFIGESNDDNGDEEITPLNTSTPILHKENKNRDQFLQNEDQMRQRSTPLNSTCLLSTSSDISHFTSNIDADDYSIPTPSHRQTAQLSCSPSPPELSTGRSTIGVHNRSTPPSNTKLATNNNNNSPFSNRSSFRFLRRKRLKSCPDAVLRAKQNHQKKHGNIRSEPPFRKLLNLYSNKTTGCHPNPEQQSQSDRCNQRRFPSMHNRSPIMKSESVCSSIDGTGPHERLLVKQRLLKRKDRRATLSLSLILGSFIACWLPFFLLYLLSSLQVSASETVFDVVFWLGYCNSALNPVIYTFMNQEFKNAFRKILRV